VLSPGQWASAGRLLEVRLHPFPAGTAQPCQPTVGPRERTSASKANAATHRYVFKLHSLHQTVVDADRGSRLDLASTGKCPVNTKRSVLTSLLSCWPDKTSIIIQKVVLLVCMRGLEDLLLVRGSSPALLPAYMTPAVHLMAADHEHIVAHEALINNYADLQREADAVTLPAQLNIHYASHAAGSCISTGFCSS